MGNCCKTMGSLQEMHCLYLCNPALEESRDLILKKMPIAEHREESRWAICRVQVGWMRCLLSRMQDSMYILKNELTLPVWIRTSTPMS